MADVYKRQTLNRLIGNEDAWEFGEDVFAQRWCTYTYGCTPDMELHVNDEFWRIYDSSYCRGNFGSCMTDENRTSF